MTTSIHSVPLHSSGTPFAAHAVASVAGAVTPQHSLAEAATRFAQAGARPEAGPQPSGLTRNELRQIVLDILG
ncbi:hypothetical protein [Azospirillum picis]|uniref:Uncharacterized protein n=1 Tax=Azospirillum picis TaxID=488438 RepID=A0ABU0MRG6_9PROT|nr:hypothetical protein [Azospirillum picis]MBP2300824.1 hypothetical protein [Azospirillum picis]MDQ0536081.1 hypothetical protein [Azospirillum picis]